MTIQKETRTFDSTIEVRPADDDSGKKTLRGHAAVFDSLSENLGGFREQITPGAFDGVLEDDVRALFNHDSNFVLGRTRAGTLNLSIDERGLAYEIDMPDTTTAKDLMESIKRGDISQSSFGFRVEDDDWSKDEDGRVIRTIKKVGSLLDVSPVTYPAYQATDATMRSLEQFSENQKQSTVDIKRKRLEIETLDCAQPTEL